MIIEYDSKKYIVIRICFDNFEKICPNDSSGSIATVLHAITLDKKEGMWEKMSNITVVDGKLPEGLCINRQVIKNRNGEVMCVLCLECDAIYRYGHEFWEDLENNKYEALKIYHTYINNIKELHGLPLDDLSFIEQYAPIPEKTAEERRQDELSAELDEYLRIGEELSSKEKKDENKM